MSVLAERIAQATVAQVRHARHLSATVTSTQPLQVLVDGDTVAVDAVDLLDVPAQVGERVQVTFDLPRGITITSRLGGVGIYRPYTPTLTAVTSDPDLGGGSIAGRFTRIGDLVHCYGRFTFGAGSSAGSGAYIVSLPVTAANPLSSFRHPGTAFAQDSSVGTGRFVLAIELTTDTTFVMRETNADGGATVQHNQPFAWTTDDQAEWSVTYEAS